MSQKEEINNNIWEIWKISLNAKRFLKYSFYLHKPDTNEEFEYLKKSRDFKFIADALWRNCVIELSKLFYDSKKRDKFNIFHFIKKLEKDVHFRNFKISKTKIDFWYNQIEENRKTIDLITELRDKVYAHTDGPIERIGLDTPTFEQTEKLIDIIESVITEIYSSVFDSHAMMNSPNLELNPSKIIKILAAEKKARISDMEELLKK
ncbi:hypothetical protein DET49_13224 [Salegentibacter sp. 24]|uniref:AbiU2 domain-containing protein n=1 Tax=Salegentibacter sp. 24 TaxID=2183986 RepID=UPI001061B9E4|nr:hypothetical protein [Salegentibacter sp. 24]TDN80383.1 hypothetical protein DET49_13224 [Salegentibacter sp. 24]